MWVTVLSQDMQDVVIVDCIATMDVTAQFIVVREQLNIKGE